MDREAAELSLADVEQTVIDRAVQLLAEHFAALNGQYLIRESLFIGGGFLMLALS